MTALRAGFVALSVALSAAALTGCAAGQQAQTANEKPSGLDGTQGRIGNIQLEGVALHAPSGSSWASGSNVPLSVYIVNTGRDTDTLTSVRSTAFTGWSVVPGANPVSSPAAATAGPTSPAAGGTGSAGGSTPQQIPPNAAVGLSLQNIGTGSGTSAQTLLLQGLASTSAPLFPGDAVRVTFTFDKAGQTTLTVPVELSESPNDNATLPGSPAPSEGG